MEVSGEGGKDTSQRGFYIREKRGSGGVAKRRPQSGAKEKTAGRGTGNNPDFNLRKNTTTTKKRKGEGEKVNRKKSKQRPFQGIKKQKMAVRRSRAR